MRNPPHLVNKGVRVLKVWLAPLLAVIVLLIAGGSALPRVRADEPEVDSTSSTSHKIYMPLVRAGNTHSPISSPSRTLVVRPEQLSSSTVLGNTGSGWYNQVSAPRVPMPMQVSYRRYEWRELEQGPGEYDFSVIEEDLQEALANGQLLGIRVRAMKGSSADGRYVPDYMSSYGWWDGSTFVPDWNHPYFLERSRALLRALGEQFDGRVYFMDIGMLYKYGEWSYSGIDYGDAPSHIEKASFETMQALIDYHVEAFPRTRLLMFTVRTEALKYALKRYPRVGLRSDAMGNQALINHFVERQDSETRTLIAERWKTAPIITEFIGADRVYDASTYREAVRQAEQFHISMMGDNNIEPWDELSDEARGYVRQLARMGYRFTLHELALPAQLAPGSRFTVDSRWQNLGTTPAYEPWQATLRLRDRATGQHVWEGALGLDFERLLPGEPVARRDQFQLPASVPAGSYDLVLTVRHPGQAPQMMLAIDGLKQGDNNARWRWYELGTIRVGR